MAAIARDRGFDVEIARFERWDPAGRRFDAIIAGQSWHWIDPTAGAAGAAAALRPGGRLALFWNVGDPPAELATAFAGVYRSVDTGLPFTPYAAPAVAGYRRILAPAEAAIRADGRFTEPEQQDFGWTATVTTEQWLDQVPTAGGHSRLPAATLAALLAGLRRAIDDVGGTFEMRNTTMLVTARRRED